MFLDFFKGKLDESAVLARRAVREFMRYASYARVNFSNLLRIKSLTQRKTDDVVIKRLQRMKVGFQAKESIMTVDPFKLTFLEKVRESSGTGFESNRLHSISSKLQLFGDTAWSRQEAAKLEDDSNSVSTVRSRISDIEFVDSASEIFFSAPRIVAADIKAASRRLDSYESSVVWLSSQTLDFLPENKPTLAELFLSVQNYALRKERVVQTAESIDCSPVHNFNPSQSDSMEFSADPFPEMNFMDEDECVEFIVTELNVPLFDLPVFDVNGNMLTFV